MRFGATWHRVTEFFDLVHSPGASRATDLTEVSGRPGTSELVATATVCDSLDAPLRRVVVRVHDGKITPVDDGRVSSHAPSWSPDGTRLAYLAVSDAHDRNRVCVRGPEGDREIPLPGTGESCVWTPGGDSLLVSVADAGADKAGAEGSGRRSGPSATGNWLPTVETAATRRPGRSLWLVDPASGALRPVSAGRTVWEAGAAGPGRAVAVLSEGPDESDWYGAHLALIDLATGVAAPLHRSDRQLGRPAGSPAGTWIAVIEADCSDRGIVAGTLLLFDHNGQCRPVDTEDVDVTGVQWLDDHRVAFSGIRGVGSVVGVHDAASGETRELWATEAGLGDTHKPEAYVRSDESVVATVQRYREPPAIVHRAGSGTIVLATTDHPGTEALRSRIGDCRTLSWAAPDGQRIEGLLVTPAGPGPHPLVAYLHGGPIWAFRDRWLGSNPLIGLLASQGYAVLCPNPRGSSGRGPKFAAQVLGDVGGGDCGDILSGIDHLVDTGAVDSARIGVMGGSYGGYLSAWLVTQDDRFKAAVPVAPVTHWRTLYHTTNIRQFVPNILRAEPFEAGDVYDARSPLTWVGSVRTPCLSIAGARDLCTPAAEAEQFHRALLDNGVESTLVVYPAEGHGVRTFPAILDYCTRVLDWFGRFMPAGR
ncbi:dipeptidyl aminopeptidase/acylaminoacyl peptidase [Amycolatopsis bartoniae]|uniref:S9 family peptidase n=1 Tax=Amycolatopsis bartoniae TaxID=941986 RepID=UPI0016056D3F|nr:prolyl oligopeptidase family serine peptidase [Amycolatopsis bartoniae]MBB2936586.1 dipeptidyl aminopeptidase/acylaminoacyl peptidase [Amycolatopsis bartoniae]